MRLVSFGTSGAEEPGAYLKDDTIVSLRPLLGGLGCRTRR
jgi:hypothetical protein